MSYRGARNHRTESALHRSKQSLEFHAVRVKKHEKFPMELEKSRTPYRHLLDHPIQPLSCTRLQNRYGVTSHAYHSLRNLLKKWLELLKRCIRHLFGMMRVIVELHGIPSLIPDVTECFENLSQWHVAITRNLVLMYGKTRIWMYATNIGCPDVFKIYAIDSRPQTANRFGHIVPGSVKMSCV